MKISSRTYQILRLRARKHPTITICLLIFFQQIIEPAVYVQSKPHLGKLRPAGHSRPFVCTCPAHARSIVNLKKIFQPCIQCHCVAFILKGHSYYFHMDIHLRDQIQDFCVKKGHDIPQLSDEDWLADLGLLWM